MNTPDDMALLARLRAGICGDKGRIRDAGSGCDCALAADRLEALTRDLAAANERADTAEGLWQASGVRISTLSENLAGAEAALNKELSHGADDA